MPLGDERGGIIGSWLLQLLGLLAVLAVVGFEILTVGAATLAADDTAREVARAAHAEYRAHRSFDRATATAQEVAATHGAQLLAVQQEGDAILVTVRRQAPTLVAHRIGGLRELTLVQATGRVDRSP